MKRHYYTPAISLFCLALAASSTHAALITHLALDDGTGTSAADSAGGDNNGTLNNGPTWTTGVSGGGLAFDGINQFVNISDITGIPTGDSVRTVSIWFNVADFTAGKIFGYGDPGNGDFGGVGQAFAFSAEGDGQVLYRYSGGNVSFNLSGNQNLSLNTWYHLAAVVPTGTTNAANALVYLNGTAANALTVGNARSLNTAPSTETPGFYLANDGASTAYFDGTLDDLRIYDTALDSTEVASLYNAVIPEPAAAAIVGLFSSLILLRRRR